MAPTEVISGLKKIHFLADVPDDALEALAMRAKMARFSKQMLLISEGDDSSSLYIILSGKVRVFSRDEKSKEVTLLIQESGSYFGELALLGNEPRSASVETLEKTVCSIISKHDFINWLTAHPDVMISLLHDLSEKIIHLTEKVKQMALSNVYERTIRVLQEMATKQDDIYVIHNRPTQQELATMVGASREMINKIMKELTVGGYVSVEGKTLKIESKLPASW
ncbi:MAG: Crp/Fnr family transcriptional regulator [Methylococcaceae bacterium]